MAVNLTKGKKPDKALLKLHLKQKISEHVEKLRIERAMARENINRAVGVGHFDNFEKEYNTEYQKSRTKDKDSIPSKRKLKKVSSTVPTKKLL